MASKNFYLVDTENVGSNWRHILPSKSSKDEVLIFYTENSPYISYTDMIEIIKFPESFKAIKCYTGRDALDFQLDSYLGFLLKSSPKANFIIISNDNGFDVICHFWQEQGYSVSRLTATDISNGKSLKNESDSNDDALDKSQDSQAANKTSSKAAGETPAKKDVDTSSSKEDVTSAQKKKVSADKEKTGKKQTKASANKIETISNNVHQPKKYDKNAIFEPSFLTPFIPEKYKGNKELEDKLKILIENSDLTKLQPLYNMFVKQFGQTQGLELYKALKPHIKEFKTTN